MAESGLRPFSARAKDVTFARSCLPRGSCSAMPSWRELWHIEFLGNDLGAWTLAIVTFLVTFTVLPIVKGYISTRRSRWAGHEPQQVHLAIDLTALLVERTSRVFLWGVALYLGSLHLSLPPRIEHALTVA